MESKIVENEIVGHRIDKMLLPGCTRSKVNVQFSTSTSYLSSQYE